MVRQRVSGRYIFRDRKCLFRVAHRLNVIHMLCMDVILMVALRYDSHKPLSQSLTVISVTYPSKSHGRRVRAHGQQVSASTHAEDAVRRGQAGQDSQLLADTILKTLKPCGLSDTVEQWVALGRGVGASHQPVIDATPRQCNIEQVKGSGWSLAMNMTLGTLTERADLLV